MWHYEGSQRKDDTVLENMIFEHTKNKHLAHTLSRFWNLYEHLVSNPPKDVQSLQSSILIDNKPFFTEEVAERVFSLLPIIKTSTTYAKFIRERIKLSRKRLLRGGQANAAATDNGTLDNLVDFAVQKADEKAVEVGLDASKPTWFGRAAQVGSFARGILTLPMRILPWLESNPYLGGPLWKAAIDILLTILPKIILIEDIVVTLISQPLMLIGVGFITETIGIIIAEILGMITFILSLAAGRKGAAFVNFIQLIPIIGPILRLMIMSGVETYQVAASQQKTLGQLPLVGKYIYTEPTQQPITDVRQGGRRSSRGRRTSRRTRAKSPKLDRARRRSTANW
jgi:hypothetical protein